jgi:hypothetical protein
MPADTQKMGRCAKLTMYNQCRGEDSMSSGSWKRKTVDVIVTAARTANVPPS